MTSYAPISIGTPTGNNTPRIELLRDELQKALSQLEDDIRGLESRILPVLIPPYPSNSPASIKESASTVLSPVAAYLTDTVARVSEIRSIVNGIKDRLEI